MHMKSHQTHPCDRDGEVWQFVGSGGTRLFLIVGQSPRRAYRLVDLATGTWSAVNGRALDGNPAQKIPPNSAWTRVS